MRTLDKFFALINDGNPFKDIDSDIEVWRKVEEFIGTTRLVGELEVDPVILSTEKLLLRSIISYLINFQPETERNYSTIADILRTALYKVKGGKNGLDDFLSWVATNHEESFCYQQYLAAKHVKGNFDSAVVCLLDKLTVLEILEKNDVRKTRTYDDKIITQD